MLFLLGKTQRGESQPFTDSSRLRTPAGRRLLQMGALSPSIHSLIHSFVMDIFTEDLTTCWRLGSGKMVVCGLGGAPALIELTFRGGGVLTMNKNNK